jgi:hypothetical protein
MPSSTSNFERSVPALPWARLLLVAAALMFAAAVAWEIRVRSRGYAPTLDDTMDLWAEQRAAVKPDSLVVIGDSRPLFDIDLDALEAGLGKRPVQLSIAGSSCYPILQDLAADDSFRGDLVISLVPIMYFTPGSPLIASSEDALKHRATRSPSQRFGNHVFMFFDRWLAFINQDDLNLKNLLLDVSIADRPGALVPPRMPPFFSSLTADRRARMVDECAREGSALQAAVEASWQRLFVPPPPPTWIPPQVFQESMGKAVEGMYAGTVEAIKRIRARGGRVVWVRFPFTEWLKAVEDKATPRAATWDRVIRETGVPGIHFEDHPELASFRCPEWSHLSGPDSVDFTRKLAPHLKRALESQRP